MDSYGRFEEDFAVGEFDDINYFKEINLKVINLIDLNRVLNQIEKW